MSPALVSRQLNSAGSLGHVVPSVCHPGLGPLRGGGFLGAAELCSRQLRIVWIWILHELREDDRRRRDEAPAAKSSSTAFCFVPSASPATHAETISAIAGKWARAST